MSYISQNPQSYSGQVVGNGQCVAFVRASSGAPATAEWHEGAKVKGAAVPVGAAIATFVGGVYPNNPTGNHAAIYVSQNSQGVTVWDQWVGQPVHTRLIKFNNGTGSPSNDGDAFSIVE